MLCIGREHGHCKMNASIAICRYCISGNSSHQHRKSNWSEVGKIGLYLLGKLFHAPVSVPLSIYGEGLARLPLWLRQSD